MQDLQGFYYRTGTFPVLALHFEVPLANSGLHPEGYFLGGFLGHFIDFFNQLGDSAAHLLPQRLVRYLFEVLLQIVYLLRSTRLVFLLLHNPLLLDHRLPLLDLLRGRRCDRELPLLHQLVVVQAPNIQRRRRRTARVVRGVQFAEDFLFVFVLDHLVEVANHFAGVKVLISQRFFQKNQELFELLDELIKVHLKSLNHLPFLFHKLVNALQDLPVVLAQNVSDVLLVRILRHHLRLNFANILDYLEVVHLVLHNWGKQRLELEVIRGPNLLRLNFLRNSFLKGLIPFIGNTHVFISIDKTGFFKFVVPPGLPLRLLFYGWTAFLFGIFTFLLLDPFFGGDLFLLVLAELLFEGGFSRKDFLGDFDWVFEFFDFGLDG